MLNIAFVNVTVPVVEISAIVSVSTTVGLIGVFGGTLNENRSDTLFTRASSASMMPLPLMSTFDLVLLPLPALPNDTITSERVLVPTARLSTLLLNVAANSSVLVELGGIVTCGTS